MFFCCCFFYNQFLALLFVLVFCFFVSIISICGFLSTFVLNFFQSFFKNYFRLLYEKNKYWFVVWNQVSEYLEMPLEVLETHLLEVRTIVRVVWSNSLSSQKFICWVILSKFLPTARWVKEKKENHTRNFMLCYNLVQSFSYFTHRAPLGKGCSDLELCFYIGRSLRS